MSRRVVSPALFEDEWFGYSSDREQLVWIGLFAVLADDQGRLADNPALVRARLWPYRDVPVSDVGKALDRFVAARRLHRYSIKGKPLLQIVNWWQHQRPRFASPSALPAPAGWQDRVKTRINGRYVEEAWELPGGFAREGFVQGSRTSASHEGFVLAHEPVPVPKEGQELLSTADAADALEDDKKSAATGGTRATTDGDDGFGEFWQAYPRRVGKAEAQRRWRALSAADRRLAAAAAAQLAANALETARDLRYIAHPATFIGPKRHFEDWTDGAPPGYEAATAAAGRERCPKCAVDVSYDEAGAARCPACNWKETTP